MLIGSFKFLVIQIIFHLNYCIHIDLTYYILHFLGQMVKRICPSAEISSSSINNDSIFNSYKELIKRQDETIASLTQQVKKLKEDAENLKVFTYNSQFMGFLWCKIFAF